MTSSTSGVVAQNSPPAPKGPPEPVRSDRQDDRVRRRAWNGPTYYGRPQLKAAPFENGVVGGYIFLAGLSGAAALLAALADRRRSPHQAVVRRGRYLSLAAPTIGAGLLVYDLRTPSRFYNMLRVVKPTSPMSIGTWVLLSFAASAGATAAAQAAADLLPGSDWPRRAARAAQIPAALTGAGMMTYTAALLAATSTPLWAAAPEALGVRFAASSVASGAAALLIGQPADAAKRWLAGVASAALAVEWTASAESRQSYKCAGLTPALRRPAGLIEQFCGGLGALAPMAALAFCALASHRRSRLVGTIAAAATLASSAAMRISLMSAGDGSALDPDVSLRFAQPDNLPDGARELAEADGNRTHRPLSTGRRF